MNIFKNILRHLILIITIAIVCYILIVFWEYKIPRILSISLGILGLLIFTFGHKISSKFLVFFYLTLLLGTALSIFLIKNEANTRLSWAFYVVYGIIIIYLFVKLAFRKKRKTHPQTISNTFDEELEKDNDVETEMIAENEEEEKEDDDE